VVHLLKAKKTMTKEIGVESTAPICRSKTSNVK
jgi:hypothetical protein